MPMLGPLQHAFEKHAQQRAAGRPAPAVLVGREVVEAWLDAHRPRGVVRATGDANTVATTYLEAPIVRARLAARIEARVLAARAVPRTTTTPTAHENAVWSDVAHDALLEAGEVDAARLVGPAGEHTFSAAVNVLGEDAPALLLDGALDDGVRAAIALAERAPRLHLALATEASTWRAWCGVPGREHAKAMLRAYVVQLPALEHARALAAQARATQSAADDDAARSAAERALFEALEAAELSRGRFVLNQRIDVLFGNRELEIDLACGSSRIAVEVDGYFHFQNTDAYRRDRRKDIVLQQENYFVVRVLAEDITERLDETLAMIHGVMRRRGDGP